MEDSTIGEGNKRKKEVNVFRCPGCHAMITYEGELGQKIKVECPNCGKKGVIDFDSKTPEKNQVNSYKALVEKTRYQFSEKITLRNKISILFVFFITITILSMLFIAAKRGNIYIELLYVSIFIGIMLIREATDEFIPNHLKKKINIIMGGFTIVFLGIVINEIIGFISK